MVASAIIAGDLNVSYIVCEARRISVNPATLLVLPVMWPPSWISASHDIAISTTVNYDPANVGVAVGILSICALEL